MDQAYAADDLTILFCQRLVRNISVRHYLSAVVVKIIFGHNGRTCLLEEV